MAGIWYEGWRTDAGCVVVVGGRGPVQRLVPRHDLLNHCADVFEWGYDGSGCAQLALALLADRLGYGPDPGLYQDFKREVVAELPKEGWVLTGEEVQRWLNERPLALGQRTRPVEQAEGGGK